MPEVGVLLTPRELGGHEQALFGWLADAAREDGLRAAIFAPTPALREAAAGAGLDCVDQAWPAGRTGQRAAALRLLAQWPAQKPLLLAPGVLHAAAWLLGAAVLLRRRVWVYVPNAHSARRMGYRWAAPRDALLAPWLRRVEALITVDDTHAETLRRAWRVQAPVLCLPNLPRLPPAPAAPAAQPGAGPLRVAYVGRFDAHAKGLDWLAAVLRRRPDWALACTWSFQGRGPAEPLLRALAAGFGPQQLRLHPHAPLDTALARADLLLLPSRYEGVPLVALEATVRGWPVAASREAGVAALLPPASLFDFGDEAGLQRALQSLRQPAARAAAVAHARERLQALWPAERHHEARRAIVRAWRRPPGPPC